MTQSNPLPTEEQVAENSFADKRVSQRAFWAALLSAAVLLFSTLNTINQTFIVGDGLTLSSQDLPTWGIFIGALTGFSLALAGVIQIRRGRVKTGLYLAYFSLYVIVFAATLVFSNVTVPAGSAAGLISLIYILWIFPRSERRTPGIALGVFFAWLILLELISPAFRTALTTGTQNGPVLAAIFLIAVSAYLVREGWNRSYTVSYKLYIAFGVLFALTLAVVWLGFTGLTNVRNSYEGTLQGGVALQNRTDHLELNLLEARRREKDFLLRWQEQGFETAYDNYVVANLGHTADMKSTVADLEKLAPAVAAAELTDYSEEQYQADLATLDGLIAIYEQTFLDTVALLGERGHIDTGLEGVFRRSVQAIEEKTADVDDQITITMLQVRRREKDYLLRGEQRYVDNVHDLIAELKSETRASENLNASEKAEIIVLADNYLENFDALVQKEQDIAASVEVFRDAAHNVEEITIALEAVGEQLADLTLQSAATTANNTFTFTGVVAVLVLIAAAVLAVILSRQISLPVRRLTKTASEIAGGNFDVQAEVSSADEIGTLAETFNTMTSRLGEAFEDVRRRAAELATVAEVSTATSTILESQQLLQNVVDLTKERFNLYHSHIYLLDENGENLVLTAGAGEPGRVMVSEGRSISMTSERSLVARAARDRQGVTVNDVTQAPDHLPNPLLPNTRSELAVPMIVGGTVIGVFDIQAEEVGRFTESDINIQTTLAAQLATSVQNVRSFERSQKEAELQSLVNMIGSRIQRASTIEETLQTAIRELGTAIGASRVKAKIGQGNGSTNPTAAD